jgi:anti-sigma factor RsiW
MDHDATREQLELAAAEPGGLDRLMAGDTAAAQMVAAHLAGCPECTAELARLERAARLIRGVVVELPPADLRERTLATVRAAGAPRGAPSTAVSPSSTAVSPLPAAVSPLPAAVSPPPVPISIGSARAGGSRIALGWVAAIAAAVVVSVVATNVIVGGRVDERLAGQAASIEALEEVTAATLQVTAESDVRRVALLAPDPGLRGTLIFSPSTSELVVVATGLTPPPAGQEYRCWVERAAERERVGLMFFADDLAYWVGPVPAVEGLADDARFGVSLVSVDGATEAVDVLVGDL